MANEVVSTVETMLAGFAEMTITEKKEALKTALNNEISTTSNTWVKYRNKGYLLLLDYAGEKVINKIYSWIK
jgi:hypothetical protein